MLPSNNVIADFAIIHFLLDEMKTEKIKFEKFKLSLISGTVLRNYTLFFAPKYSCLKCNLQNKKFF